MDSILEEARRLSVASRVEVLVAGGGPAGFAAAVCAARAGARTMLVEQAGALGGMATTGLMSHWTGESYGGIYEEILDRSRDEDTEAGRKAGRQTIATERLKETLLEMLCESRASLRLYTLACAPVMEGERIRGVIVESKAGREAVLAETVVDSTGDGDIAARAGAPYFKGRENDGAMQPMTLMFRVAGVDMKRAVLPGGFEDSFKLPAGDLQELARRRLPHPAGHVLLYPSALPGVVTCNMTNCIEVDGTKAEDLTKAELACRGQIKPIIRFLREFVPGFEKCYLLAAASAVGVRETRHFRGEYTLTEEDILQARSFPEWAVTGAHFNFDVHRLDGSGLDPTGKQREFPQQKPFSIPYGCLVPQRVEGLLLAGRCISGTHMAHSAFRVMPICANVGQAAGTAAALCARRGILPRSLPASDLQAALMQQGVKP